MYCWCHHQGQWPHIKGWGWDATQRKHMLRLFILFYSLKVGSINHQNHPSSGQSVCENVTRFTRQFLQMSKQNCLNPNSISRAVVRRIHTICAVSDMQSVGLQCTRQMGLFGLFVGRKWQYVFVKCGKGTWSASDVFSILVISHTLPLDYTQSHNILLSTLSSPTLPFHLRCTPIGPNQTNGTRVALRPPG